MCASFARLLSPPANVRSLRSACFTSSEIALASLGLFLSGECALASLGSIRLRQVSARFARLILPPAIVRSLRSAFFAFGECAIASLGLIRLRRMRACFGDCALASLDLPRLCASFVRLISPPANVRSLPSACFTSGEKERRMCARFARLLSPPATVR